MECPLRSFIKSKLRQLAEEENTQLGWREYSQILGYLFVKISFENANRAGEARNMTLEEYEKGELFEDKSKLVLMDKHKVQYCRGSAPVVVSSTLNQEMRIYCDVLRPLRDTGTSDYFFISNTGNDIGSSYMPRQMQRYWEKTEVPGEVNASLMRKASVTYVKRNRPSLASQLATKMLHQEKNPIKIL